MAGKHGLKTLFQDYKIQVEIERARILQLINEFKKTGDQSCIARIEEINGLAECRFWQEVVRAGDYSADALELIGSR